MSEEVVFFRGSPSLIIKAGSFVLGILLIAGFIAMAVMVNGLIGIGAVLVFLWLAGIVAFIRTQVFEVTSQRLRWTRGVLTKRTDEMELYRVLDVSLVEPLLL